MVFEWDERKREQVIRERGVDLLYAAQIFEGEVLTRIDDREDYGEIRMISLGMIEDEVFRRCSHPAGRRHAVDYGMERRSR